MEFSKNTMEISYGTTAQHVLEEEYDEDYDPTEEGEPKLGSFHNNLISEPVAMESVYACPSPTTRRGTGVLQGHRPRPGSREGPTAHCERGHQSTFTQGLEAYVSR